MNPSTEQEYLDLPLGEHRLPFQDFALINEPDLTELINSLNLDDCSKERVKSVWSRHPNRLGSFLFIDVIQPLRILHILLLLLIHFIINILVF